MRWAWGLMGFELGLRTRVQPRIEAGRPTGGDAQPGVQKDLRHQSPVCGGRWSGRVGPFGHPAGDEWRPPTAERSTKTREWHLINWKACRLPGRARVYGRRPRGEGSLAVNLREKRPPSRQFTRCERVSRYSRRIGPILGRFRTMMSAPERSFRNGFSGISNLERRFPSVVTGNEPLLYHRARYSATTFDQAHGASYSP